jgi:hypothetical protein
MVDYADDRPLYVVCDLFPLRNECLLVGASFGVVRPARAGARVWKHCSGERGNKNATRTAPAGVTPFDMHDFSTPGNQCEGKKRYVHNRRSTPPPAGSFTYRLMADRPRTASRVLL